MEKTAQKTDTKTRMIQVAFDLFHSQGINATSVDEILEKSGTGKSQFYHYFKNKEGLIHSVVQFFFELLKNNKLPMDNNIETWDDLERWLYFFVNHQKSTKCARGCPMATIAYELTTNDELIRQDINLICEYTKKPLLKFFHGLKSKGELKPEADPEALTDFCYGLMQGGMITSKIQQDTTGFERSIEQGLIYLKSLKA